MEVAQAFNIMLLKRRAPWEPLISIHEGAWPPWGCFLRRFWVFLRETEEPRRLAIREGAGPPLAGAPGNALINSREEAKEPRCLAFRPFLKARGSSRRGSWECSDYSGGEWSRLLDIHEGAEPPPAGAPGRILKST